MRMQKRIVRNNPHLSPRRKPALKTNLPFLFRA
jgi:hypothetical protein